MKVGVDWGGTKIEVAVLTDEGDVVWRKRQPTPQQDYEQCVQVVRDLVLEAEREVGTDTTVGLGIPGTISPATGLVKNANSTWLNGQPLDHDVSNLLERPVRVANDANCLALSEAVDGAGAGHYCVFAVIIGTGVGGGIAINGRPHGGRSKIAGEWGHSPLPWPQPDELPGTQCWCGLEGCLERYLSGPGLAYEYVKSGGQELSGESVIERMREGERLAITCFERYVDRMARGLAVISNILDPDVIVLGGGLSNISELYDLLPNQIGQYVFSDVFDTPVKKVVHGDSSGVRGAAWLWGRG